MTNPTSNFGWVMPNPTDLVTDLPADFEVFGQAVDTSMADLKGGTTGQILSKATNTDMDFTWITNDVGDITAVNVTAPITGGGTSGAVTIGVSAASTAAAGVVQLSDSTSTTSSVLASTPTATKAAYDLADGAIAKTTVTTAGDIIYRNATVPARLGIGTAGQVLAVNSGATAPEWIAAPTGGGMTLLSTTSMVTLQTITVSSISAAYNMLFIELIDAYPSAGGGVTVRFNNNSTSAAYQAFFTEPGAGSVYPTATPWYYTTQTNYPWTSGSYKPSDTNAYSSMTIQNYANTSARKQVSTQTSFQNNGSVESVNINMGFWNNTAAINEIAVTCASGTWTQGSLKIWGIK